MRLSRRDVILFLTFGVIGPASSSVVEAQAPGRVYRVGYMSFSQAGSPLSEQRGQEFVKVLREHGFVNGQNLIIERRFSEGREDRHVAFATELVQMKVDSIVAVGTAAARAAKAASDVIPIVVNVANAERTGLVSSLARPGDNLTGVSSQIGGETSGKAFQLFKEALPGLSRVALLWNPDNPASTMTYREGDAPAARTLGIDLLAHEIKRPEDLEPGLAVVARERVQLVLVHTVLSAYRQRILEFSATHRLPVAVADGGWVRAGAFISYAPNFLQVERQVATYVARILNGAKARDLPVEQPNSFELGINLKTAKALRLTISPSLLSRADDVVQ